jgi:hypothetical protein
MTIKAAVELIPVVMNNRTVVLKKIISTGKILRSLV